MQEKKYFSKAAVSVAVASLVVTTSWAEEDQKLQTLEVWGTQISSTSISLGEDQISVKQADHLSELLRDIPGVDVGGTHSLNQRINIRGLTGRELDVRLDGAPQDADLFHHFGDLRINSDILKSADIQVGATSIINNGLGGGIRFETMDADDLLRPGQNYGARVNLGYASNANMRGSVAGYGKVTDNVDFLLYGIKVENDTQEDGDGVDMNEGDGETVNILVKTGLNIDDKNRLELSYDSFSDEGAYPARPNFGVNWPTESGRNQIFDTEYDRRTLTLGYGLDLGKQLDLEATLYHSTNDIWRFEDGGVPATRLNCDIDGEIVNTGLTIMATSALGTGSLYHGLTYGVEYQKQTSEQTTTPRDSSEMEAKYANSEEERLLSTFYIEDRLDFGRVAIIPGIRYNNYERTLSEETEQDWSEFTYALAGEVQVLDEFLLKTSYTQLFRGPQLTENFATSIHSTINNDDLKAETGHNYEIGFEYSSSQVLGFDHFILNGSAFNTTINDYIEEWWEPDNYDYVMNLNAADVEIKGFEVAATMYLGNFDSTLSYSRSKSEATNVSSVAQTLAEGDPVEKDVGDSLGIGLGYQLPEYGLNLGWDTLVVMENDRYQSDAMDKPGYTVHSMHAQWKPDGSLENMLLTFGIDNVFDKLYASHASYVGAARGMDATDLEPGRNIKLSLAYTF